MTRPGDPLLSTPPILTPSEPSAYFMSVITTTATVRRHLKKLPTCKASGPDGIPNRVLKALAPSLCAIFSTCHLPRAYFLPNGRQRRSYLFSRKIPATNLQTIALSLFFPACPKYVNASSMITYTDMFRRS